MKKISEKVTFFGSGPVAAKALKLLARDGEIEAVVTKPKPAHHRGDFPVLSLTEKLGLKTYTPANKQELSELFAKRPVSSRLGIVIDYGIIISSEVINYFPLGIVNSHFSLLPRWRGADPITFAILEGDVKTGVSLMVIDEGLDTGKLITQKTLHLKPEITTPELTTQLIDLSHELLLEYLPRYISGELSPHAQPHPDRVTHSRKLTKDDSTIDWSKTADVIEREIRAFLGWPGSRTTIAGKDVIITKAYSTPTQSPDTKPGTIEPVTEAHIIGVVTGKGTLWIERLKPAGKKDMSAAEFIRGYLR